MIKLRIRTPVGYKFYHDATLNTEVILSHIISSETEMLVQLLMGLEDPVDGIKVRVRWHGIPEDTIEPIVKVYKDVQQLVHRLLARKITPQDIRAEARRVLGICKRGL